MVTYFDGDRDEVEDWKELKLGRYAIQKYEYNEINSDFLVQYDIYMICDDSGLAGGGLDFIITAITLLVERRRSVVCRLLAMPVGTSHLQKCLHCLGWNHHFIGVPVAVENKLEP